MDFQFIYFEAKKFVDLLESEQGYSHTNLNFISYNGEVVSASIDAKDDFQESLPYHQRWCSGWSQNFTYPFNLAAVPSREERELHVLAAKQGESIELAEAMQSAFAKRFVENLRQEREAIGLLLRDHRGQNDD